MKHKRLIRHAVQPQVPVLLALFALGLVVPAVRADLQFAQPRVDIGEARTGLPLAHRFAFVNAGAEPVEITDIISGCGCLTPRFEQRLYHPGESGSVLLEIHTLSQSPGPHTWIARVQWRSRSISAATAVQLTARMVSEIRVHPAALTIVADSAVAHDISLTDIRPQPLSVRAVRSTSTKMTAQIASETQDPAGCRKWNIHIAVAEDFPPGRHEEAVTIYTDDPAYRDLRYRVTIIKNPGQRVAALPDRVMLTAIPGTPLPAQLVRLRDRANQAIEVEQIVADDPAITCRWAPGPDTMATMKILVDHNQLHEGGLQTAIHVHIRKPAKEVVTLPVQVSGE
jgi:hypothetical protein